MREKGCADVRETTGCRTRRITKREGRLGVEGQEENKIIEEFNRISRKRMLIKQAEGSDGGGSLDDDQDVRRCASENVLEMSVVLRLVKSRACRREGWMMCFWKWGEIKKKYRKTLYGSLVG